MSRHACLVVCTILVVLTSVTCFSVHSSSRIGKFFPYIVNIVAGPCQNFMGYYGTCYSKYECGRKGGIGTGSCANGYGVCCVGMVTSCNEQVLLNDTYFQNPDYPSTTGVSKCPITIRRPPNICQVRIDFEVFSLTPPNSATGVCTTDTFTVDVPGSTRSKVPTLCGTFSNEHIYVDFEGSDYMTLNYMGTSNAKKWKNRIQMIECNSVLRAPDGCLQYYYTSGGTGQVKILGYNPSLPPHLANLKYTSCVRREVGRDSITWKVCDDKSFSMSGDATITAIALQDTNCEKDYIQMLGREEILDATGGPPGYSDTVFCETALNRQASSDQTASPNQPIKTSAKPFAIHVETDALETASGDKDNVGFCLTYWQA